MTSCIVVSPEKSWLRYLISAKLGELRQAGKKAISSRGFVNEQKRMFSLITTKEYCAEIIYEDQN